MLQDVNRYYIDTIPTFWCPVQSSLWFWHIYIHMCTSLVFSNFPFPWKLYPSVLSAFFESLLNGNRSALPSKRFGPVRPSKELIMRGADPNAECYPLVVYHNLRNNWTSPCLRGKLAIDCHVRHVKLPVFCVFPMFVAFASCMNL